MFLETWDIKINSNVDGNHVSKNHFENLEYYLTNDMPNLFHSYKDFSYLLDQMDNKIRPNCLTVKYKSNPILLTTHILDLNQTKYNILEKYVYDIAKFHFDRLNLQLTDDYTIEYSTGKNFKINRPMHFDHQHIGKAMFNMKELPFLSTLTYFDNSIFPTIITNIENEDEYLHKLDNSIYVSFPKPGKHIVFEGSKYCHGNANIIDKTVVLKHNKGIENKRHTLTVFFWNKKIDFLPTFKCEKDVAYDWTKDDTLLSFETNENNEPTQVNIRNPDLLPDIFYDITRIIKYNTYYPLEYILMGNGYKNSVHNFYITDSKKKPQQDLLNNEKN